MFQGFHKKGFQFLKELKKHNSREWFMDHKDDYELFLREPSKELIAEMEQLFIKLQLPYEATPKKSLFRINRDIRFSKNKNPYKTNIGISFPVIRDASITSSTGKTEVPGAYLHIEPNACFIAGGLYMPDSRQLKAVRERIENDWKKLHAMQQSSAFRKAFPSGLIGEKVKTMPRGFDPEHPGREYLRMKQFIVMESIPDQLVQSADLIKELLSKAKAMAAIMMYLNEAISD
ncbi:MAG: DUF2461 domain-containing protein [bacterium]